jgi:hypothetical protein
MKEFIIIILIIIIIIILSFTNIERFINTNDITCESSNINLDIACNAYNAKKASLLDIKNNYNSARKITETRYTIWNYSKNEISLKKAALDQAIIVDTYLNSRNNVELLSKIILSIIYAKAAVTVVNYQYATTSIEYINAINNYNSTAANANLMEINNGYNTPAEALDAAINLYNNTISKIPTSENLTPTLSNDTPKNILENSFIITKNALRNLNDVYLIPSLAQYNSRATAANIKNYTINDDLSSLKSNAQYEFNLVNNIDNEEKISTLLINYKSAITNELEKFNTFFNLIIELKTLFISFITYLIDPENGNLDNIPPSGLFQCSTKYNLISLANVYYTSLDNINNNKIIAKNKSINHPIAKIVDENILAIETKYNNLLETYTIKRNMLMNNNEIMYDIIEFKNASTNFDIKYLEYINGNNELLKYVLEYNLTSEKQKYNELSKDYIYYKNIYLNLLVDIKRCHGEFKTLSKSNL